MPLPIIYLYLYVSFYLSIYLSIYIYNYIYNYIYIYIYKYIYTFRLYIYICIYTFRLHIYIYIYIYIYICKFHFDLIQNIYKLYEKPNDDALYINKNSNHPPTVIKQIPKAIAKRISDISSNKEIYDRNINYYKEALERS